MKVEVEAQKEEGEEEEEEEGEEEEEKKEEEGEEFAHTRSFTLQQQYLLYLRFRESVQACLSILRFSEVKKEKNLTIVRNEQQTRNEENLI